MMRFHVACLVALVALPACGWQSGEQQSFGPSGGPGSPTIVPRHGTVVIDGCAPSLADLSTLDTKPMKELVSDVIFLCFTLDTTGAGQPVDPQSRVAFSAVVQQVRALGYTVFAGLSLSGDSGGMYNAATTETLLESAPWKAAAESTALDIAMLAQGLDLDLQGVPDAERDAVTELVAAVSRTVRPARTFEIFVPPSITVPSDLPDGDAFDLGALGGLVDRVRVMTLDYSLPTWPGPTIDSGWAVDAVSLAAQETSAPLDVSVPLYGWDFDLTVGTRTPVTFAQAAALAHASDITRSLAGDLSFNYYDGEDSHQVWFDDAEATLLTLAAFSPDVLPPGVGVLFYGLGDGDPALWGTLAEATKP